MNGGVSFLQWAEMKSPNVSVIIPAYNHERYVRSAVESVLTQEVEELELIVVDDGSTDRTGEIVLSIKDPRIRYVRQDNQDAYNAINNGLRLAGGRYLAILNSDDVYVPGRLPRLIAEAERTGAQFLFTHVEPIDERGEVIPPGRVYWHIWHERNRGFLQKYGDLYTAFLRGNLMVTTSNVFMARHVFETVGLFAPLRYLHDYDYVFRVLLALPDKVRYLKDDVLLRYRIHGSNTLREGAIRAREEDLQVIAKYMLASLPESCRQRAAAGAERLRELERELADVRRRLRATPRAVWAGLRSRIGGLVRRKAGRA